MSYSPLSEEQMARSRYLQYNIIKELQPVMRKYFTFEPPVGMISCYFAMSKLKILYAESLRTLAKDKDNFDEQLAEMDRANANDNPLKDARPFLEMMSKILLQGEDKE